MSTRTAAWSSCPTRRRATSSPADRALTEVLTDAQRLGFLGPGPVTQHLEHADGFAAAITRPPAVAVDLGSGGGVPGLILAVHWPASTWILVESGERRAAFLQRAVASLGLDGRCTVDARRAELVGLDPLRRGQADLVTARSFGPPAVVAECAAPLLRVGGSVLVSEPPDPAADRWPAAGLAALGLEYESTVVGRASHIAVLEQVEPCPEPYPRRVGVPAKRPLF